MKKCIIFGTLSLLLSMTLMVTSVPQAKAANIFPAGVTLLSSSNQEVRFEVGVKWRELTLETVELQDVTYTEVTLPGAAVADEEGAPGLPMISETLAVPFGAQLNLVVIPGKSHTQKIDHPIIPVATQRADWGGQTPENEAFNFPDINIFYEADPEIYSKFAVYPGILGEIANDGVLRQQRVVGVALYPLQYNPMAGELTIYESFEVILTFSGSQITTKSKLQPESEVFEELFSRTLLNYEDAKIWRSGSANKHINDTMDDTTAWVLPDPAWRIKVREEGFYSLTYSELEAVGLDVDHLDPRTFSVYHLGQEIAIQVLGEEDGTFNSDDKVIFYGEAMEDKYTEDNVYWLTYGGQNDVLRMQAREVIPATAPIAQTFEAQVVLEENNWYISNPPGDDDLERFLWAGILATPSSTTLFDYNFSLPTLANGIGQLNLDFIGQTTHNQGNKAIVSINEEELGTLEWIGMNWGSFSAAIPLETLVAGTNTLKIRLDNLDGTIYDFVYLDRGELAYTSFFQTESDILTFNYELVEDVRLELKGFSREDLLLFDISDPNQPVVLQGFEVQPDYASFKLTFQEESEVNGEHSYWAAAQNTFKQGYVIEQAGFPDLNLTTNGADYLIITHSAFLTEANQLADHRQAQGLRTKVVNVEDIYDQFGFGIVGKDPIQKFLKYAYHNWAAPAPTFVILFGDGHYNPKGYNPDDYGPWRESFIPPYLAYADPGLGETTADNRYAMIVGEDNLPDMMLGRLAVTTVEQAAAFVEKIIAYEQSPADIDWSRPVLAVADNPDHAGNFTALSEILLINSLPSNYQAERVYMGLTHNNVSDSRAAVINAINDGKFLVNYIGHAAHTQWAGNDTNPVFFGRLFGNEDVDGLTNFDKYPIIAAMTCWEGYYINPQSNSQEALAEVITRAEGKGAIASFSPTGTSVASGHDIMDKAFFKAIFTDRVQNIGMAVQKSLIDLWANGSYLYLPDNFLLFGDPATVLDFSLFASSDTYYMLDSTTLQVTSQNGVLKNDHNPDMLALAAKIVSDVNHGQLVLNQNGSFTYTPELGFVGNDSFSYEIFDGTVNSNTAIVTIIVQKRWDIFLPVIHR